MYINIQKTLLIVVMKNHTYIHILEVRERQVKQKFKNNPGKFFCYITKHEHKNHLVIVTQFRLQTDVPLQ